MSDYKKGDLVKRGRLSMSEHDKDFHIIVGEPVYARRVDTNYYCDCNGKLLCTHVGQCQNIANWAIENGNGGFFLACTPCFDFHCPPDTEEIIH
ncbi:MAG: hypothetical protein L0Y56_03510 [Nitrospira sp.]|nr:hypothetical protein [Nitrospira sp.]